MLSFPREQQYPVLSAALPSTECEAFLVARDHSIATLAATELRAAINSGHALLSRRRKRLGRPSFI